MQLGGYIALRTSVGDEVETVFVCADDNLLNAARSQSFPTIDPLVDAG
jgi:hypothetical protein